MDRNSILEELREERERLDRAISALEGTAASGRPGRPGRRGRRHVSAAGRLRIAEAQRARWARVKGKKGGKVA